MPLPGEVEQMVIPGWVQKITTPTEADHVLTQVMVHIDAIKKSIDLQHSDNARVPTLLDKEISRLKEYLLAKLDEYKGQTCSLAEVLGNIQEIVARELGHFISLQNEKFAAVKTSFEERDIRVKKTGEDASTAVAAALTAQKESVSEQNKSFAMAVSKSEASTTKQIEQLNSSMVMSDKAKDDKINDLKERVTLVEGQRKGGSDFLAIAIAIVAVIASIIIPLVMHK